MQGQKHQVRVLDLSEGGMRIVVPAELALGPNDHLTVALGNVLTNVAGRVRWMNQASGGGESVELGISFDSLLLKSRADDEVEGLFEAWENLANRYTVLDAFVEIIESLDQEVVDDRLRDLAGTVRRLTGWIEQRVGPLAVWQVIEEPGRNPLVRRIVDRGDESGTPIAERERRASAAAAAKVTEWHEGRPYLYAGQVVIEFFGATEGRMDLLQRIGNLLALKIVLWTKILIKNQAIALLGEELDRHRHEH